MLPLLNLPVASAFDKESFLRNFTLSYDIHHNNLFVAVAVRVSSRPNDTSITIYPYIFAHTPDEPIENAIQLTPVETAQLFSSNPAVRARAKHMIDTAEDALTSARVAVTASGMSRFAPYVVSNSLPDVMAVTARIPRQGRSNDGSLRLLMRRAVATELEDVSEEWAFPSTNASLVEYVYSDGLGHMTRVSVDTYMARKAFDTTSRRESHRVRHAGTRGPHRSSRPAMRGYPIHTNEKMYIAGP